MLRAKATDEINKLKISVEEAIAHSRHKKEQDAIAKYVAADTLNMVSAMAEGNDVTTKGENKFITVFFSDICAFSRKCERYSAKKIVNLLNTYFDMMVEILSEHEAIIDKFIGDAIVARFDTGHQAHDAKNCVFASWKMLKKLNEYNEESLEEIHCRIGINSGKVILGNLGSEKHRLEYAMIGDNVNIGQRLESSAPKHGCMISASTYELVSEFVEVGQKIKKGQTVMIVEAMKTMNHVPSTADGEVKKILVQDGQAVEFGQTLVLLK